MLTLRSIQFVIFPKAITSISFVKDYSETIKSIIGGNETIFGLDKKAPIGIPRLIITDTDVNFSLSLERIDTMISVTTDEDISFEMSYLKKFTEIFEKTLEIEDIILDKIGIIFNFTLSNKEDTELLWSQLISKKVNQFAEIQQEKSIRIVTEIDNEENKGITQHLLISEYRTKEDENKTETLISIDENNINKDYEIKDKPSFETFMTNTIKYVNEIKKNISAIYEK